MKNKNVGYLIIGISIIMIVMILIFNSALKNIVAQTCTHGPSCSMYSTISTQTWISIAIVALVFLIGLFLVLSKESEKVVFKKQKALEIKRKPINYSTLDKEEKAIVKALEEAQGTMFQSDIVDKTQFDKVKVTRILDRLEGKQLIERKRRGMTNVVILK